MSSNGSTVQHKEPTPIEQAETIVKRVRKEFKAPPAPEQTPMERLLAMDDAAFLDSTDGTLIAVRIQDDQVVWRGWGIKSEAKESRYLRTVADALAQRVMADLGIQVQQAASEEPTD